METKKNPYQIVTEKIAEQLENGVCPWVKPWASVCGQDYAVNYVTRKPYSFLNCMLVGEAGEYITFNQVKQIKGASVKKGAKARQVVYYQMMEKEVINEADAMGIVYERPDGSKFTKYPVLKYYNVFHVKDCEGIESKREETTFAPVELGHEYDKAIDIIDHYVQCSGVKFECLEPTDRAFFSPARDFVQVPMIEQYSNKEEFFSTTFHELTHSTGVEKRLNRQMGGGFGSQMYAREELVAEMGSAMLCAISGIDSAKAFNNSVAYLKGWATKLRANERWIVTASAQAEKAARYILGENEK